MAANWMNEALVLDQALLPSKVGSAISALQQDRSPEHAAETSHFRAACWKCVYLALLRFLISLLTFHQSFGTPAEQRETPRTSGKAAEMASAGGRKMLSAEERRRQRELEEARKAGLAPAEVSPLSGRRCRARYSLTELAMMYSYIVHAATRCRSGRRPSERQRTWRQRRRRQLSTAGSVNSVFT